MSPGKYRHHHRRRGYPQEGCGCMIGIVVLLAVGLIAGVACALSMKGP